MKTSLITILGFLFVATQARTSAGLKSLLQTAEEIGPDQNPTDYGFPASCNFTWPNNTGPPGGGSTPPGGNNSICQCPLVVNGTGAGLPGLGSAMVIGFSQGAAASVA
jgi:hypothetical protein